MHSLILQYPQVGALQFQHLKPAVRRLPNLKSLPEEEAILKIPYPSHRRRLLASPVSQSLYPDLQFSLTFPFSLILQVSQMAQVNQVFPANPTVLLCRMAVAVVVARVESNSLVIFLKAVTELCLQAHLPSCHSLL
jgi:hypothetical protein